MARDKRKPGQREPTEFVTHKFRGKRFQNNTLDVDALHELIAYKQLVLAAAQYLSRQDGGRAQRGLVKGLDLAIKSTSCGSFGVTLVQSAEVFPLLGRVPDNYQDVYTKARDFVADTIKRASNGIGSLPDDLVKCFDRFGRHLEGDESIALSLPGQSDEICYDRHVRAAILQSQNMEYEDVVETEGEVRFVNLDEKEFGIKLSDGRTITGRFSAEDEAKITKAVRTHNAAHIHIIGIGRYGPDGLLREINSATYVDVTVVTPGANAALMAIDRQIEDLLTPQDLGTAGIVQIDKEHAEAVANILHAMTADARLPLPYLYATPEGSIQAEWPAPPVEIMCEFKRADILVADVLVVNTKSGAIYEATFERAQDDAVIEKMIAWVRPFMLLEVSSDE